jgi:hypothetical protein
MKIIVKRPPWKISVTDFPHLAEKNLIFWIIDSLNYNGYKTLIEQFGIPNIVVSSAHPEMPFINSTIFYHYCPDWFQQTTDQLVDHGKVVSENTQHCFNFMINKKQINRSLMLKLIEWFDLSSYVYTWSGLGAAFDMSGILNDIDLLDNCVEDLTHFRHKILAPVNTIKPQWLNPDGTTQPVVDKDSVGITEYGGNLWTWNNLLSNLFSQSAVSLITESIQYEKTINYTEKTVYSVLGLTFPIWIGGHNQAKHWQKMGFDTFDDIIDHSYQHYDSLLERCFYAFNNNIKILKDVNYARYLRKKNLHRLEYNRSILKSKINTALTQSLENLPEELCAFYKSTMPESSYYRTVQNTINNKKVLDYYAKKDS